MSKKFYISSTDLVGRMKPEDLDLSNLPDFPLIPQKTGTPEYMGFVSFFKEEEEFGFIVTNGQGIDGEGHHSRLREVFFHVNDWKGERTFEVGDAVKFTLSAKKGDKLKALNISLLDVSEESYEIGKKYIIKI